MLAKQICFLSSTEVQDRQGAADWSWDPCHLDHLDSPLGFHTCRVLWGIFAVPHGNMETMTAVCFCGCRARTMATTFGACSNPALSGLPLLQTSPALIEMRKA